MDSEKTEALIGVFEPKRQAARRKSRIQAAIGWSALPLGAAALFGFFAAPPAIAKLLFAIAIILIVGGALSLSAAGLTKKNYQKDLLASVGEEVDKAFFPGAYSDPHRGVSLRTMMAPGFFSQPDRYIGEDFRTAEYHGISFEQGHYRLQKRFETSEGRGRAAVSYADYAIGTMYHFSFARDFGQVVKVLERKGTLSYGTGSLKQVETEYIEFNRKFVVLASDETTCFFLLTPQVQEKIMSLEGMFKGQFYLAFVGHELFIAANNSDRSVKVPWKDPLTAENMQAVIESFALPAVFIDLLGLAKPKFEENGGAKGQ